MSQITALEIAWSAHGAGYGCPDCLVFSRLEHRAETGLDFKAGDIVVFNLGSGGQCEFLRD